ncbi:winged helix-turn-helix transcriptional regulator [Thermococcus sp. GR7]|uniref:helix-turn-helix transcriptional regulator n=1 Tax=unclassified Thermococcus TaxID=2627626 RepID=UPI001431A4C8|nr:MULTISPECIES: helix-turn-helix domain-containing protein [unclassified Thermococcus]NJE46558.1 winged helix-turn-helix transcriptional regulator [Thermococcus sp. GR7]NJE79089.1 winged helix-turn-helix transcriptional regulator [Thermococcus sp. GR4]NJF23611.1 winged helix-turn-helix transcriptional regulator [Thermococcus sp. GR5]
MERKSLVIFMITALILVPVVSGEYTVSSLVLTVYEDGYVKVEYELLPADYASQIEVSLFGEHYENLFVENENGNPLNFRLDNGNLLIYSEDAQVVRVSYYTPDLTSKDGIVWTLKVSSESPFTVVLPENCIVVDLSDIPLEIAGNSITMPLGNQSVSYTLQYTGTSEENSSNYLLIALFVGVVVIGGIAAYLLRRRGSGGMERPKLTREGFERRLEGLELNDEEKRALLYIFDKGGRASQAEVREAIGLPKTTAWRMFKRLERKGLVKVIKGRKENWVELRF